ncbi:hypothetical protein P1J78_16850 [Psychromarinibacter sp. C21-152]|uniref:Cytochrome C oxidase assembly protein n=1 Tax=Psychromarinibacter sediminicola TaxID=3033385 RepID=A0AAE3TB83_9RHOB|nr:hypothetical protein [Psychromarinibacter sediminicola]MDF0602410.1 hypothetical protein [Psychromarinibacter sediminicola]
MALRAEHEIHKRRRSRNVGVGIALAGFVALVFALSVVKINTVGPVEGFDHTPRASALPPQEPAE